MILEADNTHSTSQRALVWLAGFFKSERVRIVGISTKENELGSKSNVIQRISSGLKATLRSKSGKITML